MTIYLVRHAKAGDRNRWRDDDFFRPLTTRGRVQARGLVDLLRDARFARVLSSPYVRCVESVVPLAAARGIGVEPVDALVEGALLHDAAALVPEHAAGGAVLCTHGDVVPMLLEHYAATGVDLGPAPEWPKGSVWALETGTVGEVVGARYLPPPE